MSNWLVDIDIILTAAAHHSLCLSIVLGHLEKSVMQKKYNESDKASRFHFG